ncbi:MAG: hypothetical protein AB8D52_02405 [Gammaproteobacteria bacterium]
MESSIRLIAAHSTESQLTQGVYVRTSNSSASASIKPSVDQNSENADHGTQSRSRWQNTPGIRVSLQSLNTEPQIEEYRSLKSDGRRKASTMVSPETVINPDRSNIGSFGEVNFRSVNPRSKMVLDDFIQQMGGAAQPVDQNRATGSLINTSV